jgi:nicotinate-nucleotide adenylyltransferase
MSRRKRIGIYSGTFDPVHTGHITFALQALKQSSLDEIYFLPERRPRNKAHVEHFAHRVAMLKQASRPHPQFKVLELVDISFSIERTLPKLKALFAGDQLVFLLGSDVLPKIISWPNVNRLLKSSELIVGLRSNSSVDDIKQSIDSLPVPPKGVTYINSYAPGVSSENVKEGLRNQHRVAGILRSVERYSNRNWLYISLAVDKP